MRRVNTLLRRIALPLGIAVAVAALLLMASPASAQEPAEAESGARLHPGINLIGWVGEPTLVSQLFREIPQLEAIWAWDAELDDWIVAARNAPEWLGGLGRVSAGMGLRMQLGGDAPVIWERSTEPTRGLVKLRTGWNLVAWSGADSAAIDDVAKGIGWSLRSIRRWDAATQQWATWTSPERSAQVIADTGGEEPESSSVRRGEALWVQVSRSVNWLQPTDILPRLVFPGGASQRLQARVREDLQAVLSYYRDQYGIQADPDFTIYVPKHVGALLQAYRDDGEEVDDAYEASTRALWNRVGGWAGKRIVVKQSSWTEDRSTYEITGGRYLLTHEYFHVLQNQLSDSWPTQWLVEGTADWGKDEHRVMDDQQTWEEHRQGYQSKITNSTPTLRSTESDNARWQYTLGWLATDLLTADVGPDSWIAFWRHLASTEIGPRGRWRSSPDWRTAFQEVFGMPVADFYVRFDSWQRDQPRRYSDDGARWIRGQITREGGMPVAGVFVNAIRIEGETSVGWNQRAETDAAGAFAVRAPRDGDYRLSVDINDVCTRYYSSGELIDDWDEAQTVEVVGSDLRGIDIQLPPNVCGWQIRGRIIDSDGAPLAGTSVGACLQSGSYCPWGELPGSDGAFVVVTKKPGDYRLLLNLIDGCSVYYSRSGPTFERDDASLITVADADVDGIVMRVSTDICHLRVGGSVGGIERFLDGYVWVHLCQVVENWCRSTTSRRTENDGPFAVAVPDAGAYRLSYNLDGCEIHYGPTGLTSNDTDAALINIGERNMRVGHRQVPADVCAYEISGTIIDADGNPLAETHVSACEITGEQCVSWTGRRTDENGTFAITVPVDGAYRISFSLDGCSVYFGRGRLTSNNRDAWAIRVAGRDVQVSPRAVPEGMCAQQISGRLVDSDDAPLSGVYISICQLVGGDCAVWLGRRTDEDGMFAVTVPTEGVYRVSFSLEGCSVYYRGGGLTTTRADASPVSVTEANSPNLRMRVAEGMCAYQISGSITSSDGQPLTDTRISACREVDNHCVDWAGRNTDADGSFAITVPTEGRYRLSFNLEGCTIYFRRGGFTTTRSERSTVRVEGRSVRLNPRQVPEGMCAQQISGRLVDSNNMPLSGGTIYICQLVDGSCKEGWYGRSTDDDGSFARTLSSEGAYLLYVDLDGCKAYYRVGGLTIIRDEASPISVTEANSPNLRMRVPAEMCAQRISGRFVDAAGAPLAEKWINAFGPGGSGGVWTDANGRFEIRVPADGAYHFGIQIRSQPYCWHDLGGRALGSRNNPVRVSGADVTGVVLRLPDTIENLCE